MGFSGLSGWTRWARDGEWRRLWSAILSGGAQAERIARSGLFDPRFYRSFNGLDLPDEACLGHFLRSGAAAGLRPHALFDPGHYRNRAPGKIANPLEHYLRRGWKKSLRPNPLFDPAYYLKENPDVRAAGFEPLGHYASHGWREGRMPVPEFDPLAYRSGHDLLGAREPLGEVLLGLRAPNDAGTPPKAAPTLPTADEWASLASHSTNGGTRVDVVMPVFGGRNETLRAVQRVLAACSRCGCELVVVNDASPDPVINATLAQLAERGLITLLVNERNRGFVGSVNRGMALHPDRDVILLNADTEVFGDWIDRLRDAVAGSPKIATATPWSNAATILSYPIRLRDNYAPLEIGWEALDRLAAQVGGPVVDIPTAVGFCMYIRRNCLADIGPFDEQAFGRGYGEENDFCRKAARRGWRHVAVTGVYVQHYAASSFGAEKEERVRHALAAVERLHPGYFRLIDAFIARDALAPHRRKLDEARVRQAMPQAVLRLGGDPRSPHPADRALRLRPDVGPRAGSYYFESDLVPVAPNLPSIDPRQPADIAAGIIKALGISRVEFHGVDMREPIPRKLRDAAHLAQVEIAGTAR